MEGFVSIRYTHSTKWEREYAQAKNGKLFRYQSKGGILLDAITLTNIKIEMITTEPLCISIEPHNDKAIDLKFDNIKDKVNWINALCSFELTEFEKEEKDILNYAEQEEFKEVQSDLTELFKAKMLNNTGKLDAYLTQVWTLQGLLEACLSDFSMEIQKVETPVLNKSIENIKDYTNELKVIFIKNLAMYI